MRTWKDVGKRYEWWMDAMLMVNFMGVYLYLCLVGSSDAPTIIALAGLNIAMISMARREEIKRILTPKQEEDELRSIIRRVK